MGTPVQVKKQVEEAEALARELGMDGAESPPTEGDGEPTPAPEPAAESPAEPTPEGTADVVEITAAEQQPAPEGTPPAAESEETYEQKFKTLQGKYNKETADMRGDLNSLREQMQTQTALLAALQTAPAAEPAAEPGPAPAEQEVVLTSTEVEDYGEELLDVVGRKALLVLQPTLNTIMERLQKLESGVGKVEQTALKTERDKVYDALDKWGTGQSPAADWRAINSTDEFKAWLSEADPFAGAQRGALLRNAFESNDATRVVAFFAGYLKEQTTVTPGAQAPIDNPATPAPAPTAQVALETLVAPGGAPEAAPASAHGDSAGRTFSQAEIAAFYSSVQRGKYRGKEDEKNRIEAEIHDAANNGRVTG